MSVGSLRQLAGQLNLSHSTVSAALRGCSNVKPTTRTRVLEAAEQMGYQRNPLAGALMAEMRRSRGGVFRGTVVVLDIDGAARPAGCERYRADVAQGATQRAGDLGFTIHRLSLDQKLFKLQGLNRVCSARRISGVLVLPFDGAVDMEVLDWSGMAGAYADSVFTRPHLHAVGPDYHEAMAIALDGVAAAGYRRPGLVLSLRLDRRLRHRWAVAFKSYQAEHGLPSSPDPLVTEDPAHFARWFQSSCLDVVLTEDERVLEWMRGQGVSVPHSHGFCLLNLSEAFEPCAGLDLHPRQVGEQAMEVLVTQIFRDERGIPLQPTTTLVRPAWRPGPTLRDSAQI